MVGVFSIYHVYCAAGNSTTIEGWEKDRVATMVRRGKIREVKYPYVRSRVKDLRVLCAARRHADRTVRTIESGDRQEYQIGTRPQPALLALASKSAERWIVLPRFQGGSW